MLSKSSSIGGFTVLMSVYKNDDANIFLAAVNSVFANTLLPNDFILIVDGPIPPLLHSAIESLKHKFAIRIFFLPNNIGLANALNYGLKFVRTEWVARADADDLNSNNRFEIQVAAINEHDDLIDIVGGNIVEVDKLGNILAKKIVPMLHTDIINYCSRRNPFNHMTVMFKLKSVLSVGGYPNIFLKEDYALWASLLGNGFMGLNLSDILVYATTGPDMYRRRGGIKYALAEIQMQKFLVSNHIKSFPSAFIDGILRAIIYLLPPFLRGFIYINILRVAK